MNKQQIEINCIGGYAVINSDGHWIGVFPTMLEADKFVNWHTLGKTCQIQQITAKIPFNANKALEELERRNHLG